jgi:stearoyl-CoA desaturase (delta-9 desaturase)
MAIPLFFIGHWYLSLFTQSFFLHRYAAHGMFTLNKFWERFFYIFTYIAQGSSFLNPRAYAIMHRLHHSHSDTEEDPHSPVVYPNIFGMMWRTAKLYNGYLNNRIQVSKEVLQGYFPKMAGWFENFAESFWSRIGWGVGYTLFYIFFAESWWWFLLLPAHYLMGPIHGAIVNWFGHKVGYTNFKNGDNSKNTLLIDFLMMGELFQNNHHKFPLKLNFGVKWFEFDPTWQIIRVMNWIGILKLKRVKAQNSSEPYAH